MKKILFVIIGLLILIPFKIAANEITGITIKETVISQSDIKYKDSSDVVKNATLSKYEVSSDNYKGSYCVMLNPGRSINNEYRINLNFDSRNCSQPDYINDNRCLIANQMSKNVKDKMIVQLLSNFIVAKSAPNSSTTEEYKTYVRTVNKLTNTDSDFTINKNILYGFSNLGKSTLENTGKLFKDLLDAIDENNLVFDDGGYYYIILLPNSNSINYSNLLCMVNKSNGKTIVQKYIDNNEKPESPYNTVNESELTCKTEGTEIIKSDPTISAVIENADDMGYYNEQVRGSCASTPISSPYSNRSIYRVNSTFSHLYCRETITYQFYDTVYAMAGQSFKYDIKNDGSMLTASFKGKKDCATVIEYKKWEYSYAEKNIAVVNAWNTMKKWEAAVNISKNGQETANETKKPKITTYWAQDSCTNIKTQPDYDTVLRRWYDKETCSNTHKGAGVTYTTWSWAEYEYDHTQYTWSELGNGRVTKSKAKIGNEAIFSNLGKGEDTTFSSCFTSCSVTNYKINTDKDIEWAKKQIKEYYKQSVNAYKTALKNREDWIIDLADSNLYTDSQYNTLEMRESIDDISVNYKSRNDVRRNIINNYASGREELTSCSKGNSKDEYKNELEYGNENENRHDLEYGSWAADLKSELINEGGTSTKFCNEGNNKTTEKECAQINMNDAYREIDYLECEEIYSKAKCINVKRKVPVNSEAYFNTRGSVNIYQGAQFFTSVYTGMVTDIAPQNNASVKMDGYSYPISLMTPKGSYAVKMKYGCLGDIGICRPSGGSNLKTDEDYSCNVIVENKAVMFDCEGNCCLQNKNNCTNGETCEERYGDGSCKSNDVSVGFIYRTIDLENIFPSNRASGSNWSTGLGPQVKSTIEKNGESIWNNSNNNLEYSFTLTPQNRKNIIEYNRNSESNYNVKGAYKWFGYLNNTLENCNVTSTKEFTNCTSSFLAEGENNNYFTGGRIE